MVKIFLIILFTTTVSVSFSQDIKTELQKAYQQFEADSQLKYAISSLYVIDAQTGEVLLDKNSRVGLAPASTQKTITSATAFELLGKNYKYKTGIGYTGKISNDTLRGNLYVKGSCDPTLGSWRYETTRDTVVLIRWAREIKQTGIRFIKGNIIYNNFDFPAQAVPDGWIWQDIGNYYGAPADVINWKENQYDIILKSGKNIGDSVVIMEPFSDYENELKSAAKGTGDNAYVYLPRSGYMPLISGTIPVNESAFKISAYDPNSINSLLMEFGRYLHRQEIRGKELGVISRRQMARSPISTEPPRIIYNHFSPPLDSIIYWFNKRSINLYGEALVKTFAFEKQGYGSTDSGVAILKKFWKEKGIDENELNMYDGSGLSPLNRVTTHAQVEILKYAKSRGWFQSFYHSLPVYNEMHMKSGTISDVKGFCGYHTSKDGREYIFSFLVNNYSGRASGVVQKMYKVLDMLK